ncbi:cytochrome c [uncultured Marivita sp.]|uniref:c-type cytochrome n=1 Tax=uncultured Marivita sp. TaxID=888080 RepID=UPI0026120B9F|nr:cytochrome c [uncultured Marivita sp.]
MKKTTIAAAVVIAGTAVTAFAHSGATGIVKERMDAMLAMGKAVKTVAPMMQGETPYDAETVRDAARLFQQHAGESMTRLFPEGTGGAPSEAKNEVWTEWDRFAALATQLEEYSEGLERAAGNGLGGMNGNASMGGATMMGGGSMMGSANGMMGGSTMMGGSNMMDAAAIAEMPADAAFAMTTQVCSTCHERFRAEKD